MLFKEITHVARTPLIKMESLEGVVPSEEYKRALLERQRFLDGLCGAHEPARWFDRALQADCLYARTEARQLTFHPFRLFSDETVENCKLPDDMQPLSIVSICASDLQLPVRVELGALHYLPASMAVYVNSSMMESSYARGAQTAHLMEALLTSSSVSSTFVCDDDHLAASIRYGASDYRRKRLHSRSRSLYCVRVDDACRKALLCWLWTRLLPAELMQMIGRAIWKTRFDALEWEQPEASSKRVRIQ